MVVRSRWVFLLIIYFSVRCGTCLYPHFKYIRRTSTAFNFRFEESPREPKLRELSYLYRKALNRISLLHLLPHLVKRCSNFIFIL